MTITTDQDPVDLEITAKELEVGDALLYDGSMRRVVGVSRRGKAGRVKVSLAGGNGRLTIPGDVELTVRRWRQRADQRA